MPRPLWLPSGGWLATGQSTPATYGNEGRWFNHSCNIRLPVSCCVYAHKRERPDYVRTEQLSSIRDRCGVFGQVCRQMKSVSTCIHGGSLSSRITGPIRRWQRSEMRLLFSLFRVPLQYCPNTTGVIAPLASLLTIFPYLATCVKRNGLLRNKSSALQSNSNLNSSCSVCNFNQSLCHLNERKSTFNVVYIYWRINMTFLFQRTRWGSFNVYQSLLLQSLKCKTTGFSFLQLPFPS